MKARFLSLALITGLVLAAGGLAASCGDDGGGTLTLEEFFEEVQALDDELEAEEASLEEEFDQLTEESSPDEALDLIRQQADRIEDFINSLDDLDPPDEAADLRDEAVEAGRDVVRVVRDAIDEAEGAESLEELEDFFAIFETEQAVFDRFEQACLDAEALAAENDITVDFDCEDE